MSFAIFGVLPVTAARFIRGRPNKFLAAGVCGGCGLPTSATLLMTSYDQYTYHRDAVNALLKSEVALSDRGAALVDVWPKPQEISAPASLPPPVEKAFLQGERNFSRPDCEEAAATMYRRSLDVGLKIAFPDMPGMLDAKLKKLVEQKILPDAIGEWSHGVRLIGNEAAHDLEGVTKDDLIDARAFIDTVLRYLFTLPAQIASRKKMPAQAAQTD